MALSLRSDAENRSIAIGIYANLWTDERLELMAWTRAERQIFCVPRGSADAVAAR